MHKTPYKVVNQEIANLNRTLGGPHLWVTQVLYKKGCITTNGIWDEYVRDFSEKYDHKGNANPNLINSKSSLKDRVLKTMETQGKIERKRAVDQPKWKKGGWQLVPSVALKNVDPSILATLEPLPQMVRQDYRDFLRRNNIPYEF